MGKLRFDISMSLDGFIAGPNMTPGKGLGENGDLLHQWVFRLASWRAPHGESGGETDDVDEQVFKESTQDVGAIVMGRHMFGGGEGPWGSDEAWGDWEGWWGDEPPFHNPVFVLTHHPREQLVKGATTFTFVTGGVESALEQAQAAADGRDVSIGGGANVVQQYLAAGLVDEFQVHVAPVLLGEGVRLFEGLGPDDVKLECTRAIHSPAVTHLKYRVVK